MVDDVIGHLPSPQKVKAQVSLRDVDYDGLRHLFGNFVADTVAGWMAHELSPPGFALEQLERNLSLAFHLARRIGSVDKLVQEFGENGKFKMALQPLNAIVSASDAAAALLLAADNMGHVLSKLGKWHRCAKCQRRISSLSFKKWATLPCISGVDLSCSSSIVPPPAVACDEDLEAVEGNIPAIRKARANRATENKTIRKGNRVSRSAAMVAARGSIARSACADVLGSAGDCPPWTSFLDASHELFFAGGAVWCVRCGARVGSQRKCKLQDPCTNVVGSRSLKANDARVRFTKRLMLGFCEPAFHQWPDGRNADLQLQVRKVDR